jgi:hypothetical protein
MATLTDPTYFIEPINFPNGLDNNLQQSIDTYEPKVLKDLLGYELYKEVAAYSGTSDQRIIDLVEGKDYSVDYNGRSQLIRWNGLINVEKESLITFFAYYWMQRDRETQSGNVGELKAEQQNSSIASANATAVRSYNLMIDLYGYEGQCIIEPSAFNFLTNFIDDYPEWIFKSKGKPQDVNIFGL